MSQTAIEEYLSRHRKEITTTDPKIQVFAVGGPPVYATGKQDHYDFEVDFNLSGLSWISKGYIDVPKKQLTVSFAVRIPLWGDYYLGTQEGSLTTTTSITFSISSVINGTVTYSLNSEDYLTANMNVTVFGDQYNLNIPLIPNPKID